MNKAEADLKQTNILIFTLKIPSAQMTRFIHWQTRVNASIASFPGFVSLEILSPKEPGLGWTLVQRFSDASHASSWRASDICNTFVNEAKGLSSNTFEESLSGERGMQNGVTEVFVTEVEPEKEDKYREWMAKIHQVEASFPGFRGVYVQSPSQNAKNWITLLQFDSIDHLENWLVSPQRKEVLKEAESLIANLESHRVITPYAGWFRTLESKGVVPSVWKQSMIILLVLFPIVMLEFKYLNPITKPLNISLATFIGNAISVSLLAWPALPIAIKCFKWWLTSNETKKTLLGTLIIAALYLLSIFIFWSFV